MKEFDCAMHLAEDIAAYEKLCVYRHVWLRHTVCCQLGSPGRMHGYTCVQQLHQSLWTHQCVCVLCSVV